MLFHSERVVGASFHGGIVRYDHADRITNLPDACDDAGRRNDVRFVAVVSGQRRDFEKGREIVQQLVNTLPGQKFAFFQMLCNCSLIATGLHLASDFD